MPISKPIFMLCLLVLAGLYSCKYAKTIKEGVCDRKPDSSMAYKQAILILDSSLYNQVTNSHDFSLSIRLILYSSLRNQSSDSAGHIKPTFHDSTIFQVNDWELKNFPLKTHMKFKLMNKERICDLVSSLLYNKKPSPEHWLVRNILKNDSEYVVQFVNGGLVPKLDRNGKPHRKPDGTPGIDTVHGCDFYPSMGWAIIFRIKLDTLLYKGNSIWND